MKRNEKAIEKLRVEFLPEALEIVERPASPFGAAIIWLVFLLIVLFLVWSVVGQIDEVAIARGQIISQDGVCEIQSAGNGIVKEVRVKEGDCVKKGDVLYLLNREIEKKNIEYSEGEIGLLELRLELLEQLLSGGDIRSYRGRKYDESQMAVVEYMISLDESDEWAVREYEAALQNAKNQYELTKAGLSGMEEQEEYLKKQQELQQDINGLKSTSDVELSLLRSNYDFANKEAEKYKRLYEAGAKSKAEWEAKEREASNLAMQIDIKELQIKNENLQQSGEEDSINHELRLNTMEYEKGLGNVELQETNLEAARLNLESARSQRNERLQEMKEQCVEELKKYGISVEEQYHDYETREIRAPYDGTVKSLLVDKQGAVVTATQVVAELLPDSEPLIVEAEIKNVDRGYVEQGQQVDIKIDTYDYQRYGKLTGTVSYISPDSAENKRMEEVYKVHIAIDEESMEAAKAIELMQGMQCNVEIKTDKRRIIDFFLEPLTDALDNSLNVR